MVRESWESHIHELRSHYLNYNQSAFIKTFNIISKILYFESHPDASTLMIRRYENNHISKLEAKLLSKIPDCSFDDRNEFVLDPKDIVAKYNIPTGEKSDIIIMLYKDDREQKMIYHTIFPSVFSDSLEREYLFIPENVVSFDASEEDRNSAIRAILHTMVNVSCKIRSSGCAERYKNIIVEIFAALLGAIDASSYATEYVKKFSEFITPETDSEAMTINIPDNCSLFDEIAIDVKYRAV